jgi:hypothetical protein
MTLEECMGVIKGMGLEVGEPEGYDGLGAWVPGSEESEAGLETGTAFCDDDAGSFPR